MSDGLTALASENLNPSLRSLLEDVQRGHIRVPCFQRPFVWTDSQRLDLLRSIRDNMPIGSLLVWRTIKFKLASFENIGPHRIPGAIENAPSTGWQYLLDGHQRVSTLLGLLLPVDERTEDDDFSEIDWDIQYDLLEQDFVFGKSKKIARRPLLPLSTLFDGRLVNRYMRELRRRADDEGWQDKDLDSWEERADQLSYRFQQCRIPIVVMVTDDLSLAAQTFQRINSLGTPMNEAHLVAALTWTADFDLRARISELKSSLPERWRRIDDAIYLQVCKGLVGLDMTKAGQTELVKALKDNTALLDQAGRGIKRAVDWLVQNAMVYDIEFLPYAFQLILLAVEFEKISENFCSDKLILAWFWRTCWAESFSGGAYRQIKIEQDRLSNILQGLVDVNGESVAWQREESVPDRFDFRSARARLILLRLAKYRGVVDLDGNKLDGAELLKEYGRESFSRVFVAPKGATKKLKLLIQGVGNRFFLPSTKINEFRERIFWGPSMPGVTLNANFIDGEVGDLNSIDSLERLLQDRARLIDEWDLKQWESEKNAQLSYDIL